MRRVAEWTFPSGELFRNKYLITPLLSAQTGINNLAALINYTFEIAAGILLIFEMRSVSPTELQLPASFIRINS